MSISLQNWLNRTSPTFSKIFFPFSDNRNLAKDMAPSIFSTVFGIVNEKNIGLPEMVSPFPNL